MGIFKYQARDQEGQVVNGQVDAKDADTVANDLGNRGLVPIKIEPISIISQTLSLFLRAGKVPVDEMVLFCRQMYALVKAGVPVTSSLVRLSETASNKTLKRVLRDVAEGIASGKTLSKAMADFPATFPPVVLSVIDAGENSGKLEQGFLQLSQYLELESQTQKRIKSALRYPTIVVIAIFGALMVINFMVVPAFAELFASFDTQLPLPTRILIATSDFLLNNYLILLVGILAAIIGWRYYTMTKQGKILQGYLALKIPVVGKVLHKIILSRFSRTFTMVLRAGVPVINSVELASNAVTNAYMRDEFLTMKEHISGGLSLAKAATKTRQFSPLVLQMLSVGEETGQVDDMLDSVADFYERETDYELSRLSTMLEPIILGILGIMVLVLALGVFLPMWSMAQFAGGGG